MSSQFGSTVDLLPTFLAVANVSKPADMRIDGVSLLPVLLNSESVPHSTVNNHHHRYQQDKHRNKPGHSSEHQGNSSLSSSQYSFDELNERIHLWHKDTDPYSGHERINSASYYKDIKLITSSQRGCLDRIFDMKHDPYESHNLFDIKLPPCSIRFDQFSFEISQNVLNNEIISQHCQNRVAHHHNSQNVTTTAEYSSIDHCISKYTDGIIEKLKYMFPKLVTFAKYGNRPFTNYMQHDEKKAICSVPFVSEVKLINFEEGCSGTGTCSIPMH